MRGWIGVDLDGTLAEYHGWQGPTHIGPPIPRMHARVLRWLREGKSVKCFTARASVEEQIPPVREWLDTFGMEAVEITNIKDFGMTELWDDRCVQVKPNTGRRVDSLLHAGALQGENRIPLRCGCGRSMSIRGGCPACDDQED